MTSPEDRRRPRILVVEEELPRARVLARILRTQLGARVRIATAGTVPEDLDGLDAAVVAQGAAAGLSDRLTGVPMVVSMVVTARADLPGGCRELTQLGAQGGLPDRCARCRSEPALASAVLWAIERGRLLRQLEEARRRLSDEALHDALTGLPNARLYRDRLRGLLAQARRGDRHLALLFLDLDGFKGVNDTWGHAVGDELLREVASRLAAGVRETDTVVRRGGDEFLVLLDGVQPGRSGAEAVARKLLEAVRRPTVIRGTVFRPSASIGVARFPEDGRSAQTLERRADEAMYAAKQQGGDTFRFAGGPPPRSSRARKTSGRPNR